MMLDKKMWKRMFKVNTRAYLFGYANSTDDMTDKIKIIMESTTDYKELKEELLKLHDERRQFVEFAYDYSKKNVTPKLEMTE